MRQVTCCHLFSFPHALLEQACRHSRQACPDCSVLRTKHPDKERRYDPSTACYWSLESPRAQR